MLLQSLVSACHPCLKVSLSSKSLEIVQQWDDSDRIIRSRIPLVFSVLRMMSQSARFGLILLSQASDVLSWLLVRACTRAMCGHAMHCAACCVTMLEAMQVRFQQSV